MLRRPRRHICFVLALIAVSSASAPCVFAADRLVEVLRMVPADAHAAIVVPNLKRASDDLTRMLEGMDRSGLLLGARPIDQLKSTTGFNTEIDDQGSTAIVVMDSAAQPPHTVALLAAQDVKGFFEGNFTGRARANDDSAYVRADGSTAFAKAIDSHIAMSANAAVLQAFAPGEGLAVPLAARLIERPVAGLDDADLLIVIRSPMIATLKQRLLGQAAARDALLPGAAVLAMSLADDIDTIVFAVQFDPLALIVHTTAIFKEASAFGTHAPPDAELAPDAGLAQLPAQPAALAMSINLMALGGEAMWRDLARAMGDQPEIVPAWLRAARSLQFILAPSDAGASAGALNGAALILGCDEPTAMRDAIKGDVMATGEAQPTTVATKWTDAQKLADGSTADAYEVRSLNPSAEAAAAEALLFGATGLRGYVRRLSDCVVMTFAQRQTMLAEISQAAEAMGRDAASGLDASAAVKVMRGWMPVQRDVEAYLGAAQFMTMIAPYEALLPLNGFALPQVDAGAPPIGFAMDVTSRRADSALIVPAAILAPAFDEVLRFVRSQRNDGEVDPQPQPPQPPQ